MLKFNHYLKDAIDSVQITNAGSAYGSADILNYDNQPLFDLKAGTNAEVSVVIDNGKLKEAVVTNEGFGYDAPPTLTLFTDGSGSYGKISSCC